MKKLPSLFGLTFFSAIIFAQQKNYTISFSSIPSQHRVTVKADDQPFTEFIYPDSLEKPVLFPIYAPDGQIITRGFPIAPRAGEPTDHPHHIGLWMNYENINGLDFWNNSYAIPPDKKNRYGWIRTQGILQTADGEKGILSYAAVWTDQAKNVLLKEVTTFIFKANARTRIVDRITTLTAQQDVLFKDAKDGFLGLRVAHELELPSREARQFVDDHGLITTVAANNNAGVTGNYLTSEGKTGDSAWSTRAKWCMLYGKIKEDTICIVMIDDPKNPGYPTYWHARGYGLFAANPLGQKIFSNGKQELNLSLKKSESVTFRYRMVIASGKERISIDEIGQLAKEFEK
ncbi:MAG TPA: PmoA family protein [Puia sp.]|nr:PmoA family protein [Puia sp.]